jgi:hypothetical protein
MDSAPATQQANQITCRNEFFMFTPFHFLPQRRCDQSLIATFARSLAKAEGGGENYQRQPNNFLWRATPAPGRAKRRKGVGILYASV